MSPQPKNQKPGSALSAAAKKQTKNSLLEEENNKTEEEDTVKKGRSTSATKKQSKSTNSKESNGSTQSNRKKVAQKYESDEESSVIVDLKAAQEIEIKIEESDELKQEKESNQRIEEESKQGQQKKNKSTRNSDKQQKQKAVSTKTGNLKKMQIQSDDQEEDEDEESNKQQKLNSSNKKQQQQLKDQQHLKMKKSGNPQKKKNKKDEDSGDEEYEEEQIVPKKSNNKQVKEKKKVVQQSDEEEDHIIKDVQKAEIENIEFIDVQKEQGKRDLEDQYELPYFLTKEYIKDIEGRSINDPNYDPSTLFIPIQELKKQTPVFQQYWNTKAKNYDKVVFFRFGRNFMCFYNDAILLKRLFDCPISMWGTRPVVSVFDNSFKIYIKELLNKAQKSCVIVDQVQYSDEKEDEQDIIKREVTQIITKGTYTDYIDQNDDYNSRYLMCIVESEVDHSFGITMVDCTTHQIYLDDIKNDPQGNQIRTILQKIKPVEIHSVHTNLSDQTKNICKTTSKPQFTVDKKFDFQELQDIFEQLKNEFSEKIPIEKNKQSQSQPNKKKNKQKSRGEEDNEEDEEVKFQGDSEIEMNGNEEELEIEQESDQNKEEKQQYIYGELSNDYPSLLRDIEEMYHEDKKKFIKEQTDKIINNPKDPQSGEESETPNFDLEFPYYMMLQSLSLMLNYLRELKLSDNVFRMGSFQLLDSVVQRNSYLHLDANAIENLDIFEVNFQGKTTSEGSLMHFIDYAKSSFGKRMLKKWLAYPLKCVESISQRQQAVEDLMEVENVVDQFDKQLSKFSDIERQISKIFNSTQKSRLQPSSFENFSNSRLKEAFVLIKNLKELQNVIAVFNDYKHGFKSTRLRKLCTVKDQNAINQMIENQMNGNGNHVNSKSKQSYLSSRILNNNRSSQDATKQSRIIIGMFPDLSTFIENIENQLEEDADGFCQPKPGADAVYDKVVLRIKKIYKKMNEVAIFWREKLKCYDVKLQKNKYQWEIQIPDKVVEGNKKPLELNLTSKIKGYQRFQTDDLLNLCSELKKAEQLLTKVLAPFCEKFFLQFYQHRDLLYQAVNCIGEIDCLSSLAKCGLKLKVKCKPEFIKDTSVFELIDMQHPQLLKENKTQLIPNDTVFEQGVNCLMVTGPNMGGKSTLLRQTCLAVILAQIGSFIPAKRFTTSIRDRIFSRIGASDRLLEGKSTFLVEMEETGDIVKEATEESIVLVDELGRGTSTFDGLSIAYGVLRYLVDNIKCLTLFSTHYHILVDEFKLYKSVQNYIMDYQYDEMTKTMIFKYKFKKGSAEKSFGVNVAKMAGIPDDVILKAFEKEDENNKEKKSLGSFVKVTRQFNEVVSSCLSNSFDSLVLSFNQYQK